MAYSVPQLDPEFVHALMAQDDPEAFTTALTLFAIGMLQGVSAIMRDHAMTLLLQGMQQPYVNGWLDAADTFDADPPPQEPAYREKEKET